MLMRQTTSEEARFSQAREVACDRCGSTTDLRLVVFKGRVRYAERTVCDDCAATLFELFIETPDAG
jgi:superfamily II helicase